MNRWMDGWVNWVSELMNGWMEWMDGCINEQTDGQVNGQMEKHINGWIDGGQSSVRRDGWTDRQKIDKQRTYKWTEKRGRTGSEWSMAIAYCRWTD